MMGRQFPSSATAGLRIGQSVLYAVAALSFAQALSPTVSPSRTTGSIIDTASWEVRLVNKNQTDIYVSGALEISFDGMKTWQSICGDSFGTLEADVACRMMGYTRGESVVKGLYPVSPSPLSSSHLFCKPNLNTLQECTTVRRSSCSDKNNKVGLICFNNTNANDVFEMRLFGGVKTSTSLSGRLEVRLPHLPWGTVCDDLFNALAAQAACKYLGYSLGEIISKTDYDSAPRTLLDEVFCRDSQNFTDCEHDPWGDHDCSNQEDVSLFCSNTNVRIMSAVEVGSRAGVVEMYKEGSGWLEVCDQNWTDTEAKIVCKQLGHVDGKAHCCGSLSPVSFGNLGTFSSATDFQCQGTEESISSCKHTEINLCPVVSGTLQLASVICYDEPSNQIDMSLKARLVGDPNGSQDAGLLVLTYRGLDGIVCDSSTEFLDKESSVACRTIGKGYIGGKRLSSLDEKKEKRHSWLRDVSCIGNETSLEQCSKSKWGAPAQRACAQQVHTICFKKELSLSIVNQENKGAVSGILQITYDGLNGTVCADNWNLLEAEAACRTMGYLGGQVWSPPKSSKLDGVPTMTFMSGVHCGDGQTFFQCENHGWKTPTEVCQKNFNPAGVTCFNEVKLQGGSNGKGGVMVYKDEKFQSICSTGFNDKAAQVTCRELGFQNGALLPAGSFGPLNGYGVLRNFVKCTGQETSLLNCSFEYLAEACGYYGDYASISCYDEKSSIPEGSIRFEDNQESLTEAVGIPKIRINNTDLYFCESLISEHAADMLCKQYGRTKGYEYKGGVNFLPQEKNNAAFFSVRFACQGTEASILDCEKSQDFCSNRRAAGIFCYTIEAPKLQIEEESSNIHSGRLEISVNGQLGAICADTWTQQDAIVACRTISDQYINGNNLTFPPSGIQTIMSSYNCFGQEDSIFQCQGSPWRRINKTSCTSTSKVAGVQCFTSVSLLNGNITKEYAYGDLMIMKYASNYEVCMDRQFTQEHAQSVCTELGYKHSSFLSPATLTTNYNVLKRLNCETPETSVSDCRYRIGFCSDDYGGVRLLCYQTPMNALSQWRIENDYHGSLGTHELESFIGRLCNKQWSDMSAEIVCIHKGFKGGKALGASRAETIQYNKNTVWFGSFRCAADVGVESCRFHEYLGEQCQRNNGSAAGVLCHNTDDGIAIRLMDHDKKAKFAGRVEISYNGQWGTVCNKKGGRLQARTLCKQLGFDDGVPLQSTTKRFGSGSGPIYLKDVECSVDDAYFLGCSSAEGWNSATNCTHDNDLEVICLANVRLLPEPTAKYGTVAQMVNGRYNTICSDGFTDTEAMVVCRYLGYPGGRALCCPRDRTPRYPIGISKVKCAGTEASLSNCSYEVTSTTCSSNRPAFVTCNLPILLPDAAAYAIDPLPNGDHGLLSITYEEAPGNICPDDFDHNDAAVVCRQLGFSFGLKLLQYEGKNLRSVVWPFKADCVGNEESLFSCPGLQISSSGRSCKVRESVSLRCIRDLDGKTGPLRLQGSRAKHEGRVEIQIGGVWGSIAPPRFLPTKSNTAAQICNELGFRGGEAMDPGIFGPSSGPAWFSDVRCIGNETSILDCQLYNNSRFTGPPIYAGTSFDMAVKCFQGVKLENSPPQYPNQGQLVIQEEIGGEWFHICDSGITDKEATVACKMLGYEDGKKLCCSPAGYKEEEISVMSIRCNGDEDDLNKCTIDKTGSCPAGSKDAAYITCNSYPITDEDLTIEPMVDFAGMPYAEAFAINGAICSSNLADKEAQVMCKELGFQSGILLAPKNLKEGEVFTLSSLSCNGTEEKVRDCTHTSLQSCPSRLAAQILCTRSKEPIRYQQGLNDRAEIVIDEVPYLISSNYLNNTEALLFCNSIGSMKYAYGEKVSKRLPGELDKQILMIVASCAGDAKDILDCSGLFFPRYASVTSSDVAYISCHVGVELSDGAAPNSGILTIYNKHVRQFGSVCVAGFGPKEVDVTCRMMNYDYGIQHCCQGFGFNYFESYFKNFQCQGNEASLLDCKNEQVTSVLQHFCSDQTYVEMSCFNGTRTEKFEVALQGPSTQTNVGLIEITYEGISGSVCSDGWDDNDAKVACKQLGFSSGEAYFHYKPQYTISQTSRPFWLTKVECSGKENSLNECAKSSVGDVRTCSHGHHAGVLCSSGNDIAFEIADTEKPFFGRVKARVNGVWGTICNRYWDYRDATVLCRQMGYKSGSIYDTSSLPKGTGPVYEISPRCNGTEKKLNECPHQGWLADATASCADHQRDAGVFCYSSVRLDTGPGKAYNHGPVLLYQDSQWYRVCDDNFDDLTAQRVCQELGYYNGKSICCSAYSGESEGVVGIHPNTSLSCVNQEQTISECHVDNGECKSKAYASVVCLEETDTYDDNAYTFKLLEDLPNTGRLEVVHYGITGRICSSNWTDVEASVYCKARGLTGGIAYYHSFKEASLKAADIGPFWISCVSCLGNETNLSQCKFNDRTELGNCSSEHTASVACYNEEGVRYRLAGTGSASNKGRVEMSFDNQWGTICNEHWDDNDARVVCRSLGFFDGTTEKISKYGYGRGPVWLRSVHCTGNETELHKCPHTGFHDEAFSFLSFFTNPCITHVKDAAVFCFNDVKLNLPLGKPSGGLIYYQKGVWSPVCDNSFSRQNAKVACKGLLQGFKDGLPVHGSRFGKVKGDINPISFSCTGSESYLSACSSQNTSVCDSGDYASIACYKNVLTEKDMEFDIRLSSDALTTSNTHGILEVRQNGVWGRVCRRKFTDKEATVACRNLGFAGGNLYLHLFRNTLPVVWSSTVCQGTESTLDTCQISTEVDQVHCAFGSSEAGLLCYKKKGIEYKLSNGSSGRIEISIDDEKGTVCRRNWNTKNSKVLCRHLGYKDGIPSHTYDDSLPTLETLFSFFLCKGNESSLINCINSGFAPNNVLCGGDAYVSCYKEEVRITNTRLQEGAKSNEGRLEVYVEPLGEWGTICDDGWSVLNTRVICQQMGYDDGVSMTPPDIPQGSGKILLDNVACNGSESDLASCKHNGIGFHNCDHVEDIGVRCFNVTKTLTTPAPPPPSTTRTTKSKDTTTITTRVPISSTKLHTTTTTKPTTTTAPPTTTTKKTTTTQQQTTSSTSTKRPTTSASTTQKTSPATTAGPVGPSNTQKSTGGETSNTAAMASGITVALVALIVIIVVVILFVRLRMKRKSAFAHERFHNESMDQGHDGSLSISNRLYGIDQPEGDTNFMADGSEIHLDRTGNVTFSKASPVMSNGDTAADGFSNPLYAASHPTDTALDSIDLNMKDDDTKYESIS